MNTYHQRSLEHQQIVKYQRAYVRAYQVGKREVMIGHKSSSASNLPMIIRVFVQD